LTNLVPRHAVPEIQAQDPEARERAAGMVIYGLYLASPLTVGVSGLVGLLMAASRSKRAGRRLASHFRYQVWTFGSAFGAATAGGLWAALGGIASVSSRTGGDLALAGAGLAAASGIGFMAASIFGLSRLASHEPIGEPR
jgi:uncharacterized membrane protein